MTAHPSSLTALVLCALANPAWAGFDWGADCSSGNGDFTQYIPHNDTVDVGAIPIGRADVTIFLEAFEDVDVQLVDDLTGEEIIAWPRGLLNGPEEECVLYNGVSYCYSGYNGDGSADGRGYEWIRVEGETNRPLTMYAFGYAAGDAWVGYSWESTPTCKEVGDGSFSQYIPYDDVILVGDIPAGKSNVVIDLAAWQGRDVDVQLWDGNTPLIAWPDGLLSGAGEETLHYDGMRIVYSGYNGIGGDFGHERIEVFGEIPVDLRMFAYGYQAGTADVDYAWGVGVGYSCVTDLGCDDGLACKDGDDGFGECHTAGWCDSDASAEADCGGSAWYGHWECPEHECVYSAGPGWL